LSIYRLLQGGAFEPEHCKAMADAFEDILQELGLTNRDDPFCEVVAKKILELGRQGLRNPQLLRQFALQDLEA
jgi:hypothetical protein